MSRLLVASLLIGFVFSACGRGGDFRHVRNLESQGQNVICFGDSLTEGVGAGGGADYPSILARELPHPVINAGRRGDTTADGLSRLEPDVLAHNPRLVIVLFGGNDFLRKAPLGETRKNLDEMVKRIHKAGAMVVLLGIELGLFRDEYGPLYREVAKERGALFVPAVLKGILSDPELKSDPIHPNAAGYRLMADRILERVRPLLKVADTRRFKS